MKKPLIIIVIATLYLVIFQSTPFIGIPDEAIIAMFIVAPFIVAYMAYVILKYGKPSGHTFEERFYGDYDHKKNWVRKLNLQGHAPLAPKPC